MRRHLLTCLLARCGNVADKADRIAEKAALLAGAELDGGPRFLAGEMAAFRNASSARAMSSIVRLGISEQEIVGMSGMRMMMKDVSAWG